MTLLRELHVEDDSLVQLPVREIEKYYTGERRYEKVTLENQSAELDGITGRSFDMTVEVKKRIWKDSPFCLPATMKIIPNCTITDTRNYLPWIVPIPVW